MNCIKSIPIFLGYSQKDDSFQIFCPSEVDRNNDSSSIATGSKYLDPKLTICLLYPTLKSPEDEFLVTISSFDNNSFIEVFKLNDHGEFWKCAHSLTLPKALVDATGGVLAPGGGQLKIVVCGGRNWDNEKIINAMCYSLSDPNSEVSGRLSTPRQGSASLVIDSGTTLWITGGADTENSLRISEYLQLDEVSQTLTSFNQRQTLPRSRQQHCLEKIGDSIAILAGGTFELIIYDYQTNIDYLTWTVNVTKMDWREQMPLKIGRVDHSCGVIKEQDTIIMVVAGGQTVDGSLTTSVELLMADSEAEFHNSYHLWEFGPSLPEPLVQSASVTSPDQAKLFLIGGKTTASGTTSVFELYCLSDLQCHWTKVDLELIVPSSNGLAFMLPPIPMAATRVKPDNCGIEDKTRGKLRVDSYPLFS